MSNRRTCRHVSLFRSRNLSSWRRNSGIKKAKNKLIGMKKGRRTKMEITASRAKEKSRALSTRVYDEDPCSASLQGIINT